MSTKFISKLKYSIQWLDSLISKYEKDVDSLKGRKIDKNDVKSHHQNEASGEAEG